MVSLLEPILVTAGGDPVTAGGDPVIAGYAYGTIPPGYAVVEFGDGTTLEIELVNVRPEAVRVDRLVTRAPLGTAWGPAGDGVREGEAFRLDAFVLDDTLSGAADETRSIVWALQNAVLIRLPFGAFQPAGVVSVVKSPVVGGWRLGLTILSTSGWMADDTTVLRFIDETVWEIGGPA